MDMLIKIAAVCIPSALIAGVLRKDSPAMALLVALAAGCVVLFSALGALGEITDFLTECAELTGSSPAVLGVLLRVLGIAVVTRAASDICKDAGLGAASSAAELAGTAAALYAGLPVMRGVLDMIGEML